MSRPRVRMAVQLAAGLALAGLGHYYVSALRDVYPLDGWLFYAGAAFLLVRVWRDVRGESNPAWATLVETMGAAWRAVADALRVTGAAVSELVSQVSIRMVAAAIIILNVVAALAAVLAPAADWIWSIAWVLSITIGLAAAITRTRWWAQLVTARPAAESAAEVETTAAALPAEQVARSRPNPIGLAGSIGLLMAGQLVINTARPGGGSPALPILSPLVDGLQLNLPIDGTLIVAGWLLSLIGVISLAWVTRHSLLSDERVLPVRPARTGGRAVDWRWLLAGLAGLGLIVYVTRGAATTFGGWTGVGPWLIGLTLMAVGWWHVDRVRGVRLSIKIDRVEAIALGLAWIAALGVLLYRIGDVPATLWGDEGAYFVAARDISRQAVVPDVFGLGAYALPMGGSIYQAVWIELFGENVTAWRLASAVGVWAALIPLYFLARSTLGKRAAWLSLAFMVASPYVLTYARLGYTTALSLAPVVAAAALMWAAVRRGSGLYGFAAGVAAGAGFLLHPSARFGVLLLAAWLIWLGLTRTVQARALVAHGAALALGVAAVAAPVIAYGTQRVPEVYDGQQAASVFNNLFYARDLYPDNQLFAVGGPQQVGDQQVFYEPSIWAALIARGALRTALSFQTPVLAQENYLIDALAAPLGGLVLIGLGWCLGRLRRPAGSLWAGWLLLGAFSLSALATFPPRAALMFPVTAALAGLGALGLVVVVDLLAGYIGPVPARVKALGAAALAAVLMASGWYTYFIDMPARFPPDLEQAMFWQAQQQGPDSDVTLIRSAEDGADFVPWGLREFDLGVSYHSIGVDELPAADWGALCPRKCAFFYRAAGADRVWPILARAYGNIEPTAYADSGGTIQFYRFEP